MLVPEKDKGLSELFLLEILDKYIKSGLSLIVRVNVDLNRTLLLTVTDVSTTCAVFIVRVKLSCITSVDRIKLWLLT